MTYTIASSVICGSPDPDEGPRTGRADRELGNQDATDSQYRRQSLSPAGFRPSPDRPRCVRCLTIPLGGQEEVDGLTMHIDGTIQVRPRP